MRQPIPNPLNTQTIHREFFGVAGALGIACGLPLLFNIMAYTCNQFGCPASWTSLEPYKAMVDPSSPMYIKPISWEAAMVYAAWFGTLVLLDVILPGEQVQGTLLRDGKTRLNYKFNGTLIISILFATLSARFMATRGAMPELVFVYDHLLELMNVAIVSSFVLAIGIYAAPFFYKQEPLLAKGGNTGNVIFDWFIGRELNPRTKDFDWKIFCEMRPGMLLWMVINFAMAHHQFVTYGYVTDSMILVVLFQNYYVVEGTFYESKLVTMMDITTDGFGFMLAFGDLVVVPFSYTLQARYLASHPLDLGLIPSLLLVLLYIVGYTIFRKSNTQKNDFKEGHPSTAHLKYLTSKQGSKLITSSWWGICRHINYSGDWLMSLAYTLPTGFQTPIPYYFPIFFAVLLIHRNLRDEAKCAEKYGDTWLEYKKQVPYALIPFIY